MKASKKSSGEAEKESKAGDGMRPGELDRSFHEFARQVALELVSRSAYEIHPINVATRAYRIAWEVKAAELFFKSNGKRFLREYGKLFADGATRVAARGSK